MDEIPSLSDPYASLSFRIAHFLLRTGQWARYLPKHELQLLQILLRSESTWRQFITLNLDETKRRLFYRKLSNPNSANNNDNNGHMIDICSIYPHSTAQQPIYSNASKRKTAKPESEQAANHNTEHSMFFYEKMDTQELITRKYLNIFNFRVRTLISDYIVSHGLFWLPPSPLFEHEFTEPNELSTGSSSTHSLSLFFFVLFSFSSSSTAHPHIYYY
jgi:uncharacterized membrane protein